MLEQSDSKLEKILLFEIIPISILEELTEKNMMIYSFYSKISEQIVKLALILQKKQIFSQIIITVYVSNDKQILNQIEKLEEMNEIKRLQKINKIYKLINDNTSAKIKKRDELEDFDHKKELEKLSLRLDNQNPDSTSTLWQKELKIVKKSKTLLSIIKALIFITVIFTKVILISICYIVMTIYISTEVNSSNDLSTIIHLGDLSYYLTYLALIVRSLDMSYKYNISTVYSNNDLADLLPILELYKNYTIKEYSQ